MKLNDRFTDLETKIKAIDAELSDLAMWKTTVPSKDDVKAIIADQFTNQNKNLMEMISKHDIAMKKYIEDSAVEASTAAVKAYDDAIKTRYVTREEAQATGYATGPSGEKIPVTQAPQGGGGFMEVITKVVGDSLNKAISGDGILGIGGSGGATSGFQEDYSMFTKEFEQRKRLLWRQFLKDNFTTNVSLPPVADASGHVELRG